MNVVPGKIVLKSSTSKTLSERFGEIAKVTHVDSIRSSKREESYASMKNQRLAATMANRLKSEETQSPTKENVKSRLGLPMAKRLGNQRGGGVSSPGRLRSQQPTARNHGSMNTRSNKVTQGQRRGAIRGRGVTRGRGVSRGRVATRGRGVTRGRGGGLANRGGQRGGVTSRGGRGRGAVNQGVKRGKPGVRGAGRGRGRGGGGAKKPVTQEQLDTELDKYMSKTKSVLNAQLDEYMKDVGE